MDIDSDIIHTDIINGLALQFDYDFYYTQLCHAPGLPKGTINSKLSMWKYYKSHPNRFPIKVSKSTIPIRQYQSDLKFAIKSGYSYDRFDSDYYLQTYPDVAQSCQKSPLDAYNHWIGFGLFEMRKYRFLENLSKSIIDFDMAEFITSGSSTRSSVDLNRKSSVDLNRDESSTLDRAIHRTLKKYTSNKHFGELLSLRLKRHFETILFDLKIAPSEDQFIAIITEFFKRIHFKGYYDHIKHGCNIDELIEMISKKFEQTNDQLKTIIKQNCHTQVQKLGHQDSQVFNKSKKRMPQLDICSLTKLSESILNRDATTTQRLCRLMKKSQKQSRQYLGQLLGLGENPQTSKMIEVLFDPAIKRYNRYSLDENDPDQIF
jgi:hypothetical protein